MPIKEKKYERKTVKNQDTIVIRGARVHNLKNISLEIPKNKLVVITGVSGSGKSSLAFDTIYAEGQRRFVESLSSYARQFLERMEKPDVDFIQGISPAVAIEQKTLTKNPRSTVGTQTEIYDYLRLLFARIGKTYCQQCGRFVKKDSVQTVIERLNSETSTEKQTKIYILFPLLLKNISLENQLTQLKADGFIRLLWNNEIIDISESLPQDFTLENTFVVVDRIAYSHIQTDNRFADSVEIAFRYGKGTMLIRLFDLQKDLLFNQEFACPHCNIPYTEPEPQIFSFNTPLGACPTCQGFGRTVGIDEDLVIPNKTKTLKDGAIFCWTFPRWINNFSDLANIAAVSGIRLDVPYIDLTEKEKNIIWNGCKNFDGIYKFFKFIEEKSVYKIHYRVFLSRFRGYTSCFACKGSRLRVEALNIKIAEKNIGQIVQLTLADCLKFFEELHLTEMEQKIGVRILNEIRKRLKYLVDVGIAYLTLDRLSNSLSGGESQRINLATALGSSLVGALYVLDEPTIGLHSRDTLKLISILKSLRNLGNTVILVEHDKEIMQHADYIIDLGPLAGTNGGKIIFSGNINEIKSDNNSLTGKYLSGTLTIPVPDFRKNGSGKFIVVKGARENNLKNIDLKIPLNCFVCITGVSGSGKSTLVHDILYGGIKKQKGEYEGKIGKFTSLEGSHHINNIELVDQSPIGRSSRSNPVTYLKIYDAIRELFSNTHQAKIRGFSPGHFSFNVPGGRCEACDGDGFQHIEMQFLAEIELPCEVCGGKRFKKEVLQIRFQEKNIHDVLQLTVTDAIHFFSSSPQSVKIAQKLKILEEVGLGYIHLGQSASTLSGGEAQRLKLATYLSMSTFEEHTLFIFDEPTTGLHFHDITPLLHCFGRLLKNNNSLIVIEHNIEVIKCADWIIDLGPEAGEGGGVIIAEGTPEEIVKKNNSHTATFLLKELR
jgi:excinuclease ABC subunit A